MQSGQGLGGVPGTPDRFGAVCYAQMMVSFRIWPLLGIAGLLVGLELFLAAPNTALSHLGLLLAIAAPVIAFYRLVKPAIGKRHCPTRPDWTTR